MVNWERWQRTIYLQSLPWSYYLSKKVHLHRKSVLCFKCHQQWKENFKKKTHHGIKIPEKFPRFWKNRKEINPLTFVNHHIFKTFLMKFITVIKFKIKSPNILLKESYKPMWKKNYSKSTLWYRKRPVFTVVWRIEMHPNRWFSMLLMEFLNIFKGAFLSPANAQSDTRSTLDTSKIEWV